MTNLPADTQTQAWSSMSPEPTHLAAGRSAQSFAGRTTAESDSARTTDATTGSRGTCNRASHTAHNEDPRLPSKIPGWNKVAELLKLWENGSGAPTEGTQPFPPMRSWTDAMIQEHRNTFRDEGEKKRFNKDLYISALDYLIFSQMVTERQTDAVTRVQAVDVLQEEKILKAKVRKGRNTKEGDVVRRARIAAAQNANDPLP